MVSRLDLDGAFTPSELADKIISSKPDFKIPVNILSLSLELGIAEIKSLKTKGFEGGLVTDKLRTEGYILVRDGLTQGRRRFTIAHELGHFLSLHHQLSDNLDILCDRAAFTFWNSQTKNSLLKMEAEANEFAAKILMPPRYRSLLMKRFPSPSMKTVFKTTRGI